ncbi:hypothetical protein PG997_009893 [Apiospora hydei]|uniref:Endosomal/vacuolar adapter protein YPT35 n=1 Tax=Apiospora hydei TaxID=1337664 RepID=A0ABR1VYH3_9PEZI
MATSVGLRTASTLSLSLRKNAPPSMTMTPVETPPSPPATETDSEPESPGIVDVAAGPSTTIHESDEFTLQSPIRLQQQQHHHHRSDNNEHDEHEHQHEHDDGEDSDDDVFVDSSSTRSAADSPVMSPVTSPPYWLMQSNTTGGGFGGFEGGGSDRPFSRHQRGASTDSIPIGGITLQDNENDDLLDDRNRGCWAQNVEVSDYVVVNGSATNIGAFVVWNIRVQTLNLYEHTKTILEFDDLRCRLMRTFPNFEAAVPELPPKSLISKFRPRFLEKRRAGLQYFLHCIMLNPEFSGSPVLKEFLFS